MPAVGGLALYCVLTTDTGSGLLRPVDPSATGERRMEAQLVLKHKEAKASELLSPLEDVFGTNDQTEVLKKSPKYKGDEAYWQKRVNFAREGPTYRLICLPMTNTQLQTVVEPVDTDIRKAVQSAWDGFKQALQKWSPELESAEIVESARTLLIADASARAQFGRAEPRIALIIGAGNLIWIAVAAVTFAKHKVVDLIVGAAPAIITGVYFLVDAFMSYQRGTLRWKEKYDEVSLDH
jgi:hypothetical protein